jgi:hypothetical protein
MKSNTEMARTAFRYCGGIAALFILFTGKLNAQQTKTEEKTVMQVTYQQDEPKYLVFKVTILNTSNKKAFLRVSDNNHELLYSESVSPDDTYIKTVKVPKYDTDVIEFRITNGRDVMRKVFDVKLTTKEMVEVVEAAL